jgi:hypothetical protein
VKEEEPVNDARVGLLPSPDPEALIVEEGRGRADGLRTAGVTVALAPRVGEVHGYLTIEKSIMPRSRQSARLVVYGVLASQVHHLALEAIEDDDPAIAAALADVSVPALIASVVQITGDPSYIRGPIRPREKFRTTSRTLNETASQLGPQPAVRIPPPTPTP